MDVDEGNLLVIDFVCGRKKSGLCVNGATPIQHRLPQGLGRSPLGCRQNRSLEP